MQRAGVFALLFVVGMLVFFVAGYWAGIPHGARAAAKVVLPGLLLVVDVGHREQVERARLGDHLAPLPAGVPASNPGRVRGWPGPTVKRQTWPLICKRLVCGFLSRVYY